MKLKDLDGDGAIVGPSVGSSTLRTGKPYSFAPVRTIEKPISIDQTAYPFELMAGRSMYHFGSTSTRSAHLGELRSKGSIVIHPDDALKLGVKDDDTIQVSSPVGAITGPAKTSDVVSHGMVFVPTNFPNLPIYRLFQENTTVCRVSLTRLGQN
jgi:anaerobic selenocysteine-containing dehydrogenase